MLQNAQPAQSWIRISFCPRRGQGWRFRCGRVARRNFAGKITPISAMFQLKCLYSYSVFYFLVPSSFSVFFSVAFLFSNSLAGQCVPPSHVAVSGSGRIFLRFLSLSLSLSLSRFVRILQASQDRVGASDGSGITV